MYTGNRSWCIHGILPEGGFRGSPGWREPAPESRRICGRKHRFHPDAARAASQKRQPLPGAAVFLHSGQSGRTVCRKSLRTVQKSGGGAAPRLRQRNRCKRDDLSSAEPAWQVVPPQLQFGGGNLLPSYRAGSADHRFRPGSRIGTGLH